MTDPSKAGLPPLAGFDAENMANLYDDMAQDEDLSQSHDWAFRAQLVRYGARVRAGRKAIGLTQKQLSDATGLSQPRISAIEAGTMTEGPTFRTMHRLATALHSPALTTFNDVSAPLLYVDRAFLGASVAEVRAVAMKVREIVRTKVNIGAPVFVSQSDALQGYQVYSPPALPQSHALSDYVLISGIASPVAPGDAIQELNATSNFIVLPGEDQSDDTGAVTTVHVIKS